MIARVVIEVLKELGVTKGANKQATSDSQAAKPTKTANFTNLSKVIAQNQEDNNHLLIKSPNVIANTLNESPSKSTK
jgi:hypothetical protein